MHVLMDIDQVNYVHEQCQSFNVNNAPFLCEVDVEENKVNVLTIKVYYLQALLRILRSKVFFPTS